MKKSIYLLLFLPFLVQSQSYVDILKIGYGQTFTNEFEGTTNNTFVKSFEADLTYPVVLSASNALITGISFSRNNLQLFPEAHYTSLYSTTLKIGISSTLNERWSSTLVMLPKIASDYEKITKDDFYFGGYGVIKYHKKENFIYKFGAYASSEAFGFFATPIIGWYYLSPNQRFEMDMSLPIAADVSYRFGIATLGIDYFGIGRSFRLYDNSGVSNAYVDLSSLEFASYLQFNALDDSLLLRAKFGYSSNDYEVYADGDAIDFGLTAFSFGDDRTQLNPSINGGLYVKFEAIYRFQIKKKKEAVEKL